MDIKSHAQQNQLRLAGGLERPQDRQRPSIFQESIKFHVRKGLESRLQLRPIPFNHSLACFSLSLGPKCKEIDWRMKFDQ